MPKVPKRFKHQTNSTNAILMDEEPDCRKTAPVRPPFRWEDSLCANSLNWLDWLNWLTSLDIPLSGSRHPISARVFLNSHPNEPCFEKADRVSEMVNGLLNCAESSRVAQTPTSDLLPFKISRAVLRPAYSRVPRQCALLLCCSNILQPLDASKNIDIWRARHDLFTYTYTYIYINMYIYIYI